jgi:GntR family transcriptional repressor for pyruvate dehydrogenase complex
MALRRLNVSDTIAAELRDSVLNGQLRPGEQLQGLRDLARHFGVSVSSVRHALTILIEAGLIESRPGRGTFVSADPRIDLSSSALVGGAADAEEVRELVEARAAIETLLARLAATRATPQDIQVLRGHLDEMRLRKGDPSGYLDADMAFHFAVATAARNRVLLRAVYAIRKQLRRQLELNLASGLRSHGQDKYTLGVQSHAELLDAIADHDSKRAEALVQRLVVGGQPEIALATPPLTRPHTRLE